MSDLLILDFVRGALVISGSWIWAHKIVSAVAALLIISWIVGGCTNPEDLSHSSHGA